ncbi:YciI family protein [Actinomadura gamaensis]|uniref:YciI family protein n=1 Tax=Actinomadura gamaensis TaxID=1763541 RepID=A0ABV9U8H9_9ACTN
MLMFCSDASTGLTDEEVEEAARAGCAEWTEEMVRLGYLRGGAGLRPANEAATVKVREEDVLVTDGPFAETRDQIGGFTLIDAPDRDAALDAAARHPWARIGQVEVRPIWNGPQNT